MKIKRTGVYYRTIEIGASNPGVPYKLKTVIEHLKGENPRYSYENDGYITYWFLSHFSGTIEKPEVFLGVPYINVLKDYPSVTDEECYFTKDAYYSFMEYEALHDAWAASLQAQKSTEKAQKNAKNAIIISIIALGLMLIFSSIQILISLFK